MAMIDPLKERSLKRLPKEGRSRPRKGKSCLGEEPFEGRNRSRKGKSHLRAGTVRRGRAVGGKELSEEGAL